MNKSITVSKIQKENSNLQTRIINNRLNKSDFKHYLITNFPQNHISKISQIINSKINDINFQEDRTRKNNESLGPFENLGELIEDAFKNIPNAIEIKKKKYEQFKNLIYKYRKIKGDGNCFYRAIIIRFIELLILKKDEENLKNLILDVIKVYENDKEINNYLQVNYNVKIKPNLLISILVLIYISICENDLENSYKIFITSLLICPIFDFGLILYLRFILYRFIQNNENNYSYLNDEDSAYYIEAIS